MVTIISNTVSQQNPSASSGDPARVTENRRLSYWLEKLHKQTEQVRIDDNEREHQSRTNAREKSENRPVITEKNQNLTQLGINDQVRDIASKTEADRQAVDDLVKKSNRKIISISSTFPWDIFPDTIDVEESRITFTFHQLLSRQSHSVDIKDISNVFIESSILFATLQVVSRTFVKNNIKIGHLNKKKALQVKQIIEGLRTFSESKINTSDYDIDELILKIGEFNETN